MDRIVVVVFYLIVFVLLFHSICVDLTGLILPCRFIFYDQTKLQLKIYSLLVVYVVKAYC